jgi:Protein of unknown function (DUF664)
MALSTWRLLSTIAHLDGVLNFTRDERQSVAVADNSELHVTSETQRHAGHADIIRECIDGSAGLLEGHSNLRVGDPTEWRRIHDQIQEAARLAADY